MFSFNKKANRIKTRHRGPIIPI